MKRVDEIDGEGLKDEKVARRKMRRLRGGKRDGGEKTDV